MKKMARVQLPTDDVFRIYRNKIVEIKIGAFKECSDWFYVQFEYEGQCTFGKPYACSKDYQHIKRIGEGYARELGIICRDEVEPLTTASLYSDRDC